MPSRRDQLFSYQFMVQRVVSAFVYRDAEAAKVPFPRATESGKSTTRSPTAST